MSLLKLPKKSKLKLDLVGLGEKSFRSSELAEAEFRRLTLILLKCDPVYTLNEHFERSETFNNDYFY